MSNLVSSRCAPLQMPPTAKSVLMALADNANDDGVCWPSIKHICIRTCLCERTVRGAIRWLESNNALETTEQRGTSSRYTLAPEHFGGPRQELLPGISCPPARRAAPPGTSRPTPRQEMPPPPAGDAPKPSMNHQGTITEPTTRASAQRDPKVWVTAELMVSNCPGLTVGAAKDYLAYRRSKKGALTERAWADIAKEIRASGWAPDDAIARAMNRGWVGLEASWLTKERDGRQREPVRGAPVKQLDYRVGMSADGALQG